MLRSVSVGKVSLSARSPCLINSSRPPVTVTVKHSQSETRTAENACVKKMEIFSHSLICSKCITPPPQRLTVPIYPRKMTLELFVSTTIFNQVLIFTGLLLKAFYTLSSSSRLISSSWNQGMPSFSCIYHCV